MHRYRATYDLECGFEFLPEGLPFCIGRLLYRGPILSRSPKGKLLGTHTVQKVADELDYTLFYVTIYTDYKNVQQTRH